jgi:hypothetical protein
MNKIACSFFYTDDRYELLANIAISSFKTFHPDIDVFIFNKAIIDQELVLDYTAGYCKFFYARTLFDKGYDKVISLGVDTITCGKLDEFLNNNEDVLTSLDFNYAITFNGIHIPADKHINADVVCFNNKEIIDECLLLMKEYPNEYFEQGALNQILVFDNIKYTSKIVDKNAEVVYNNRLYEIDPLKSIWGYHKTYPYNFKIENNNLISPTNKIIKIIHLVRGFGCLNKDQFIREVNLCKTTIFNEQTKNFLISICGINENWFTEKMKPEDWPNDLILNLKKVPSGFPSGRKLNFNKHLDISSYLNEKLKK